MATQPATRSRATRPPADLEVDTPTGNLADGDVDEAIELTPEQAAEARDAKIRVLIEPRDHLRGCPYVEGGGRVEAYEDTVPKDPIKQTAARPVVVAACIECAGRVVLDGHLADYDI